MKHYLIDGNNLIGKIGYLARQHQKDKQGAAERLSLILQRWSNNKKFEISLHLDGPGSNASINSNFRIYHSGSRTADEKIKEQIDKSSNPKNIILISSDHNLCEYARVCACSVMKSEDFAKMISTPEGEDEEEKRIKEINDIEEFKKLFGRKPDNP